MTGYSSAIWIPFSRKLNSEQPDTLAHIIPILVNPALAPFFNGEPGFFSVLEFLKALPTPVTGFRLSPVLPMPWNQRMV